MAAADPLEGERTAAPRPVQGDGLLRGVRARRLETAARTEERTHGPPVGGEQPAQHCRSAARRDIVGAGRQRPLRGPRRRASSRSSAAASWAPASGAEARATMTRSKPGGKDAATCRNPSRTTRLTRFLVTAFPIFRVTVIPNLVSAASGDVSAPWRGRTKNRKCFPPTLRPPP